MAVQGFKNNKCFESVIWTRGIWEFDSIAAGAMAEYTISIDDANSPEFPVVVVTPYMGLDQEYDPDVIQTYGYVQNAGSEIVIGVKNNGSSAISAISVDFVVI